MTFLELCQMVSRESGTISGVLPLSVESQEGRLLKVVNWTNQAWLNIQNARRRWEWMYGEFGDSNTVTAPGTARYKAASWNLSRLAEWHITPDLPVSIYLASTGLSDETELEPIDWPMFKRLYYRRTHDQGRPIHVAISPSNEICFGPTPNAAYIVRGDYYKTPQTLAVNGDVPELPARYHEVIAHYGLLLLAEHDEGEYHTQVAYRRYNQMMGDLRRDQLPTVAIGADALA